MASTLAFGGKVITLPGAYSVTDASALEVPALGSAGIVAVMDMGIGGKPYNAIVTPDDWQTAANSSQVQKLVKDGDLRELASVMFRPTAGVADIPGGAQLVVLVKTNPAAQSAVTLPNVDGNALTVTSDDYGLFTTQTHITIATGTDGGKSVLVEFEDVDELFDDVGIAGKFTLHYTSGTGKAEVATVTTSSAGVALNFSRNDPGLDAQITAQPTPGDTAEAVSSNAGDTTQTITVFGLDGANIPQKVTTALNGTGVVAIGAAVWNLITAVKLSAVTVGTVTLRKTGVGATFVTLAPAVTSRGLTVLDIKPVDGVFTVIADGATVKKLVVRGLNSAGVEIAAVATLTGAVAVSLPTTFKSLTQWELGNVEAARSITVAGKFMIANKASFPNLQKLKDKIATMSDFAFVSLIGNPKLFNVVDLDYVTAINIFDTTATFSAVLDDIITTVNAGSQIVTLTRPANATGAPTNTTGTVYLSGGHEGDAGDPGTPTATTTDWQNAFDKLKQILVNTVLVGSNDAAVHAQADDHAAFMCGEGRLERDVVTGAAANETFTQLKTRALNLNSRHVRIVGQEVRMLNVAGESVWQAPKFGAAIAAAMQAGAREIGTPLTHKTASKILDVRQHSSWNPMDNGAAAIQAGLLVYERIPTKGTRISRNVTTYLTDNNPAYVEAHENQEANFVAFNLRTQMEIAVGKKGFPGTPNAAKALLMGTLDLMMRPAGGQIIFAYDAPMVTLDDDTLAADVGCSVAPGINFVPISIHLKRATAASA